MIKGITSSSNTRIPWALGIAGLIPFVGTTLGYIYLPDNKHLDWARTQAAYGCSILSFMGAVHWGLAMNPDSTAVPIRYAASTVPSLIGFFSLLSGNPVVTLSTQLVGFNGLLLADVFAHRRGWVPRWYLPMRIFLTSVVTVCIGGTVYFLNERGLKKDQKAKNHVIISD